MTDAELHRAEWIAERAGMLMSDGWPQILADYRAAEMWGELHQSPQEASA
jgi:hypothetical protein